MMTTVSVHDDRKKKLYVEVRQKTSLNTPACNKNTYDNAQCI